MKKSREVLLVLCLSVCLMLAGCGDKHETTLTAALSAIYTCPNMDIVEAYDISGMPVSDAAVQSNDAADEAINVAYGKLFTEQALELLASGGRASKFHLAAADGGYTMSVAQVRVERVDTAAKTVEEFDFTATVTARGKDCPISGRAQLKDGEIASLKVSEDVAV